MESIKLDLFWLKSPEIPFRLVSNGEIISSCANKEKKQNKKRQKEQNRNMINTTQLTNKYYSSDSVFLTSFLSLKSLSKKITISDPGGRILPLKYSGVCP